MILVCPIQGVGRKLWMWLIVRTSNIPTWSWCSGEMMMMEGGGQRKSSNKVAFLLTMTVLHSHVFTSNIIKHMSGFPKLVPRWQDIWPAKIKELLDTHILIFWAWLAVFSPKHKPCLLREINNPAIPTLPISNRQSLFKGQAISPGLSETPTTF